MVNYSMTGYGSGARQDVHLKDHVIQADAVKAFGGNNEFPSPVAYALASLTSCCQVTAEFVSAEMGIHIEAYKFELSGDFDREIMTTPEGGGDDTFYDVKMNVEVTTDASQAEVEELGKLVHRRSPVMALYSRAGTGVTSTWNAVE